jgi:hypothetical protein
MPGALIWLKEDGSDEWKPAACDSAGKLKIVEPTSLGEHKYTTPANDGVDVGTNSTEILAANADRKYAAIVNDSDTDIYLGVGEAAVLNKGIRLNANGGSYEITWMNLYKGAIYGIHGGSGTKRVTIVEGD